MSVRARRFVCKCADMGKYQALIERICESLEPVGDPSVGLEEIQITGEVKERAAFEERLKGTLPSILVCWKDALEKDSTLGYGTLRAQYAFRADGSTQQSQWGASFMTGDAAELIECVTPIFENVKVESASEEPAWVEAGFRFDKN